MTVSNLPNTPGYNASLSGYDIPSDLYDAVYGWFGSKGFSETASTLMTGALISVIIDNDGTRNDVMKTIENFEGVDYAELTDLVAYLLNNTRVPTSFVGNVVLAGASKLYNRLIL
jgi:hypothetical protein